MELAQIDGNTQSPQIHRVNAPIVCSADIAETMKSISDGGGRKDLQKLGSAADSNRILVQMRKYSFLFQFALGVGLSH